MKVGIFATCLADTVFPEVVRATARLIARLGHHPVLPASQTCCGQMHVNTGYQREALPLVRGYAETFGDPSIDVVVLPSGSCTGSVRHQHPLIAARHGDAALRSAVADVAAKTYDLSELLVDVFGVEDVGAYFPHTVTYHPTCHSVRMTKVGDRPMRLLSKVEGIELRELPGAEECCGFGGTFSVKNGATSGAMVTDKVGNIVRSGAEYATAGDASCLMNISGAMSRLEVDAQPIHLAQILAATREDADQRINLQGVMR